MKKTIFFTVLLLLAVVAVATLYFSDLSKDTRQNDRVLSYIPRNAGLVTSFRYDNSFVEIFKDYKLFDALLGDEKATEIDQVKTFILQNPNIRQAVNDQTFFISIHSTATSIDLLWLTTFKQIVDEESIYQSLRADTGHLTVLQKAHNTEHYYEIKVHSINKTFYLYVNDGIALGTFSEALLNECLNANTAKIDESFISEINTSNQKNTNSLINLFINHKTTSGFLDNIFIKKSNGLLSLLKNLTGHTTLNMNFKGDALMFNGIGSPDTSAKNYLNIFLKQKPVGNSIKNILPLNTAHFVAFGVSNYSSFHSDLKQLFKQTGELQVLEDQINRVSSGTGVNFERDIKSLWGKEFATFQLATQEKLAIIQVTDGSKLSFFLEPISTPVTENIRRFNNSNILYYYFGAPLKEFSRPLFAVVDNYLVVANTISTLQQFTNSYNSERTLGKEPEFRKFNQLVANQSNVLFFNHTRNSEQVVQKAVTNYFSTVFDNDDLALKNFYGSSYQLSSEGDHFFTNVYANYIPSQSDQLQAAWNFKLNGRLAIEPQIVLDNNKNRFVIVQDNVNNLYAISIDGKKLWSWQIDKAILGRISQLDDKSILFNTGSKLYRIDAAGKNLPGFPITLPYNASYGGTLTDKNPNTLKIFIPCEDRILGYNAAGTALNGWDRTVEGEILFDLKVSSINATNYLIAGTDKGKFYFFNHNGNLIGKVDDPSKQEFKNPLILDINNDVNNSRLITTDESGALRSIFLNGKITSKNIGIWSEDHLFDVKNISDDEQPELIFLDKNQLNVYRPDSSLVFNFEFPYPISQRPFFFAANSTLYRLGIASAQDNLLYLFNEDGSLHKGFPFKGSTFFYIGNMKTDGKTYLLCGGKDNYLFAYKLNE